MKPRVGISRCLLGEDVRYDGTHRLSSAVEKLTPFVEWVPVCPEVEVGMDTPREPLQLWRSAQGLRMVTVRTGIDYTDRMNEWARLRIAELERAGLDGYVLKSGSPSCGLEGPGLFASVLTAFLPSLPVIDEKRLEDQGTRAEFLERVFAYQQRRDSPSAPTRGV